MQPERAIAFLGKFGPCGLARLEDGVTIAEANADVERMIPTMMETFPPPPARRRVEFAEVVRRAASLHGENVAVEAGADVRLDIDPDQIEQVLINLIKNAVEASGDAGRVCVRSSATSESVHVETEDDGPRLASTDNLWVPFLRRNAAARGSGSCCHARSSRTTAASSRSRTASAPAAVWRGSACR